MNETNEPTKTASEEPIKHQETGEAPVNDVQLERSEKAVPMADVKEKMSTDSKPQRARKKRRRSLLPPDREISTGLRPRSLRNNSNRSRA